MLRQELRALRAALVFFTQLPLRLRHVPSADDWRRSATYFPLAGWLVGGVTGAVVWAAAMVFPLPVACGLAVAVAVLLTGAMHEDAFADACDGFGGGRTRERTLEIMRDSHIGVFGTVGLILLIGLRWQLIAALPAAHMIGALIAAAALSRAGAISLLASLDYARTEGKARPIVSRLRAPRVALAMLLGLAPLLLLPALWSVAIAVVVLVRFLAAAWLRQHLGGYTGDCLGAVQQLGELACLLVFIALP